MTHCWGSFRPVQSPLVILGVHKSMTHADSTLSNYILSPIFSNIPALFSFPNGYGPLMGHTSGRHWLSMVQLLYNLLSPTSGPPCWVGAIIPDTALTPSRGSVASAGKICCYWQMSYPVSRSAELSQASQSLSPHWPQAKVKVGKLSPAADTAIFRSHASLGVEYWSRIYLRALSSLMMTFASRGNSIQM